MSKDYWKKNPVKPVVVVGVDADGNVDLTRTAQVAPSGSSLDLRGLLANRPAADAVDVGTTYWSVDRIGEADELSVSDGSTWVNL